jgi:hypothetical protein
MWPAQRYTISANTVTVRLRTENISKVQNLPRNFSKLSPDRGVRSSRRCVLEAAKSGYMMLGVTADKWSFGGETAGAGENVGWLFKN